MTLKLGKAFYFLPSYLGRDILTRDNRELSYLVYQVMLVYSGVEVAMFAIFTSVFPAAINKTIMLNYIRRLYPINFSYPNSSEFSRYSVICWRFLVCSPLTSLLSQKGVAVTFCCEPLLWTWIIYWCITLVIFSLSLPVAITLSCHTLGLFFSIVMRVRLPHKVARHNTSYM